MILLLQCMLVQFRVRVKFYCPIQKQLVPGYNHKLVLQLIFGVIRYSVIQIRNLDPLLNCLLVQLQQRSLPLPADKDVVQDDPGLTYNHSYSDSCYSAISTLKYHLNPSKFPKSSWLTFTMHDVSCSQLWFSATFVVMVCLTQLSPSLPKSIQQLRHLKRALSLLSSSPQSSMMDSQVIGITQKSSSNQ